MILTYTPYAPIPDRDALLSLMPSARRARFVAGPADVGPLFVYALLAFVLEREFSLDAGALAYTDQGKPYLPGQPVHLSLSHSKTHALCAVAAFPVGCDIETQRPVSARLRHRITGEKASANFFDHWTLQESVYKLYGGDAATGPEPCSWLYHEISACTAAVVAQAPFPQPVLMRLEPETLFAYAAEKYA